MADNISGQCGWDGGCGNNWCFFETILMLIIIFWLLKWLFAWGPVLY